MSCILEGPQWKLAPLQEYKVPLLCWLLMTWLLSLVQKGALFFFSHPLGDPNLNSLVQFVCLGKDNGHHWHRCFFPATHLPQQSKPAPYKAVLPFEFLWALQPLVGLASWIQGTALSSPFFSSLCQGSQTMSIAQLWLNLLCSKAPPSFMNVKDSYEGFPSQEGGGLASLVVSLHARKNWSRLMLAVKCTQVFCSALYSSPPPSNSLSSFPAGLVPGGAVFPLTLLRALGGYLVFLKHWN